MVFRNVKGAIFVTCHGNWESVVYDAGGEIFQTIQCHSISIESRWSMRLDLKGAKYAVANRSRSVDDFDVEKQIHEMSMNAIDETHEKKMPHAIGKSSFHRWKCTYRTHELFILKIHFVWHRRNGNRGSLLVNDRQQKKCVLSVLFLFVTCVNRNDYKSTQNIEQVGSKY